MLLLAIDTASRHCAAALFDTAEKKIVAQRSEDIGRGHAERLLPMLQELLGEAALAFTDIEHIAVTTGPGSFTGIRVGLSTARGLALALAVPVTGVSVFEALAFAHQSTAHRDGRVLVAVAGGRGEVQGQLFGPGMSVLSLPWSVPMAEAAALVPAGQVTLAGSAAASLATTCKPSAPGSRVDVGLAEDGVNIASVACYAAECFNRAGAKASREKPSPLYMRSADAKVQTGFAVARADG
jgi:tRNA threonylcarbamoyl adenosine modification protein YeaZ